MKKISFLSMLCCLLSINLYSQPLAQERPASSFSQISASNNINVHLVEGIAPSIKVVADPEVIDKVKTDIGNKKLTINVSYDNKKEKNRNKKKKIDVYVTVANDLTDLSASSGATINSHHRLSAKSLEVNAS